jgi:3-hydroxyacyl-CoA dehydrogenase / enoyl-CoA hydratase / 3-hydroxybutyryl-CoA epimerase
MIPPSLANLKHWRFDIDFEGVAWAEFNQADASMNTFGSETARELEAILTEVEAAEGRGDIIGLVFVSGKERSFIAGADIREFDGLTNERDVENVVGQVTALFNRVERMVIPVVAAIHGFCLGGGLEFSMACHYRIATREDATRIGLPEVKLGIIPGLHGTARMLRLAGPMAGMTAMLTGRVMRANAARAIGLVDQLVPTRNELRWAARKAIRNKRKSKGAPRWQRLLLMSPIREFLAKKMREKTAAKVREEHFPAPFRLIDLFEKFGGDEKAMAAAETRYFAPLMVSETSRNLRRVFRLSEMLKNQAPRDGFKPLRVHVIGAGTMGGDIAAHCVASGMEVSLQDQTMEQVEKALKRARSHFKKRLKAPRVVETAMARLIPDIEGRNVFRADVVIEAVFENLELKQKLLAAVEPRMKEGAILATNTSSIKIEDIAAGLADPGRLIGLHFFNPVPMMPLVEVVRGEQSREDEIKRGCSFVTAIDKFPLAVKSVPGFLVNRVFAPYMMAAVARYQAGVPKEKIDQAALKFGMPQGPIELADMVGLDVGLNVARILGIEVPDNAEMARLVREGKLGKKTGEGFYVWTDGKAQKPVEPVVYDDAELEALGRELIKPMVDECERSLAEGVVENADLVDAGVIFGTGFAPFRGGPLHYRATEEHRSGSSSTAAA